MSGARSMPVTRSRSLSRPWPGPPSTGRMDTRDFAPPRCARNMTPSLRRASRSPRACWRLRCRHWGRCKVLARLADAISTDAGHGAARIVDIDVAVLSERLGRNQVGGGGRFPRVGPDNRIAYAGARRVDTSAVALAAALGADAATSTPTSMAFIPPTRRVVPEARRMARLSHEEMLEMASLGARCCRCDRSNWPCERGPDFVRSQLCRSR